MLRRSVWSRCPARSATPAWWPVLAWKRCRLIYAIFSPTLWSLLTVATWLRYNWIFVAHSKVTSLSNFCRVPSLAAPRQKLYVKRDCGLVDNLYRQNDWSIQGVKGDASNTCLTHSSQSTQTGPRSHWKVYWSALTVRAPRQAGAETSLKEIGERWTTVSKRDIEFKFDWDEFISLSKF